MIDPCARAEALAEAVLPMLRAERKAAAELDDYDVAAHEMMTIMAIRGGSTQTACEIAAELRAFVRQKIAAALASSPLAAPPHSLSGEKPPPGP